MYINLHMIVYSKNKETKNWVLGSSKQYNGNKLLAVLLVNEWSPRVMRVLLIIWMLK